MQESKFLTGAGTQKGDERWIPVFENFYTWTINVAGRHRRRKLDWIVRPAERARAKKIFRKRTFRDEVMNAALRAGLNAHPRDQVGELEGLIR